MTFDWQGSAHHGLMIPSEIERGYYGCTPTLPKATSTIRREFPLSSVVPCSRYILAVGVRLCATCVSQTSTNGELKKVDMHRRFPFFLVGVRLNPDEIYCKPILKRVLFCMWAVGHPSTRLFPIPSQLRQSRRPHLPFISLRIPALERGSRCFWSAKLSPLAHYTDGMLAVVYFAP